jgi:hypothetical protein
MKGKGEGQTRRDGKEEGRTDRAEGVRSKRRERRARAVERWSVPISRESRVVYKKKEAHSEVQLR